MMQDLLKEEEFLKKPYNPWKLFYSFYAIAFIQIVLFITISLTITNGVGIRSIIAALLLPDITSLTMFFIKKKNSLLANKTIAIATLILFSIYYIPVICFSIIGGATLNDVLIIFAVGASNYAVCYGIMYFVTKSKQKKKITHS